MGVPNVGLNEAANWGGSSMQPYTVVPLLPGLAFSARGTGVNSLTTDPALGTRVSGKQGTLDILIQTGAAVLAAAATGSITTVAGSELVDEVGVGSIQAVSGAQLVDGETFTLNDGVHAVTVFEFDSNSSVAVGHVAVAFTSADSAATVKSAIIAAINGVAGTLAITASSGGSDKVILVNDKGGAFGNHPILESVLDPGFIVTGMSGGGETFTLNDGVNPPTTFEFDSDGTVTSGNVAVTFTGGDSANTVRDSIISAINGVGAGLAITASSGGAGLVNLTNDAAGNFGNQPILSTVLAGGFLVSGMARGAGASSVRTVGYLTDSLTSPTKYIAIRVDSTNRPYVEITNNLGATVAEVSPSFDDIGTGQPVTIRLAWDSQHAIDGGRFATFKVNGQAVVAGDWATSPTTSWTSFKPQYLVLGVSLGDSDFDGSILSVQVSNVATP